MGRRLGRLVVSAVVAALLLETAVVPAVYAERGEDPGEAGICQGLLISIDGMHALDCANCARGSVGSKGAQPSADPH